jgi:effector-binding domain-containing protein
MVLGPYATERMLIDHYISHDENDHVTEIMIPMDLG